VVAWDETFLAVRESFRVALKEIISKYCHVCFKMASLAKISKSDNVDEEKAKYNRLIKEGKELGRRGCLEKALDLFQKAFEILESEKLQRKIEKVKVNISFVIHLSMCSHCNYLVCPIKSKSIVNSPNKHM